MKTEFKVLSTDNCHRLSGVVYLPEEGVEIRGYFHIVHGMTEHIARYDRFMSELCELGFICFGYDHLGHGYTVNDESELGYIAKSRGYELLCKDVKVFSDAVREKYDRVYGEGLPYYLMGHSMGSFITRLAVEKYVTPDKYIIMGTGGKNPMVGAGIALASVIKLFRGEKRFSPLIDKLAFGGYNSRFPEVSENDPSPWLTRDKAVREAYYKDPLCTFKFSTSAMIDLFKLLKYSNRSAWFKNMPQKTRVLITSGEADPVGNYGKGVCKVYDGLKKQGKDARLILYPEARHEILNESEIYEQVKGDIVSFLVK